MSASEITESTQYLTYRLEDEVFAMEVAKVREILDTLHPPKFREPLTS